MNNLVSFTDEKTGRNTQTISTLEVAEMMEIEHSKLLRKLEGDETHVGIIPILGKAQMGVTDYFVKSSYQTEQNKTMPCYNNTKSISREGLTTYASICFVNASSIVER